MSNMTKGKMKENRHTENKLEMCIRAKKVHDGVTHAAKLFPNAYLIMIVIGAVKGNGAGFVKIVERLFRGVWTPTVVEFLVPNL